MPFEYAWRMVLTDCNEVQMESFLDTQKSHLKKNSQHEACGVCIPRMFEHTMHYVIYMCNSATCTAVVQGRVCHWYIKTIKCDVTGRCSVLQHGYHLSTIMSPPRIKLNLAMKRLVRELTDARLTPSRILNRMIDTFQIDDVSTFLPRVQRYSHHYRTAQLADTNFIEDLEGLIISLLFDVDLGDTVPFAYGYPTDVNGDPHIPDGSPEAPFVVGFSTKRLIQNLMYAASNVLHVDATFKLNSCRFPVVILGVSDVWRQFHPVCFFLVSDIKQHQIETVIRSTFRMYQTVTGTVPVVTYVMTDADNGQRNAMEAAVLHELEAGIPPTYLMCFFHVMANVRKYIMGMSATSRAIVFKHVYRIQYARSAAELHDRAADALSEWQNLQDCAEFKRKFTKQWLEGGFSLWQCLATPPGFAKTNNPVEQYNKQVKRDYTLRTPLNVNMLAQELANLARHQSARQKPFEQSPRPFADQIYRFKQLHREGRLIVTSYYRNSVSFLLGGEGRRVFYVIQKGYDWLKVRAKSSDTLKAEEQFGDQQVETFQQPTSGWIVDADALTCQCRVWFKFGYCVHLIAARLHAGLYVEGLSKKRTFASKKAATKGPKAQVGHALSIE